MAINSVNYPREYSSWISMKIRCLDENNKSFKNYGGRGITIYQEWINSFKSFYLYVGDRPENTTLHRIDNDGNYEPGNVKWATPAEQARGRRSNVWIEYNGKEQCISDWALEYNIDPAVLRQRLFKWNWDMEKALTEEVYEGHMITHQGKTQNIKEWAEELGVPYKALHLRFTRYHKNNPQIWTIEKCLTEPFLENKRKDWSAEISISGITKSMMEWIEETGLTKKDVSQRLRQGWSLEDAVSTPRQEKKVIYEHDGKSLTLPQWSKELDIPLKTLYSRVYKGLSVDKILAK